MDQEHPIENVSLFIFQSVLFFYASFYVSLILFTKILDFYNFGKHLEKNSSNQMFLSKEKNSACTNSGICLKVDKCYKGNSI